MILAKEEGQYELKAELSYDDGTEEETKSVPINVVADDTCSKQKTPTAVVAGTTLETLKAGESAVYPVTLTNGAAASRTFTIKVEGTESWADVKASPASTVVLKPGQTQTIYLFVTAGDNAEGAKSFTAAVISENQVLEQISFTANVQESRSGFTRTIGTGLLVLVILLVAIGLIIGFTKGKSQKGPKSYY